MRKSSYRLQPLHVGVGRGGVNGMAGVTPAPGQAEIIGDSLITSTLAWSISFKPSRLSLLLPMNGEIQAADESDPGLRNRCGLPGQGRRLPLKCHPCAPWACCSKAFGLRR